MAQKFYANPATAKTHENGAISYRTGARFDCLGPFAKIKNCPIECEGAPAGLRLTCYATGYADSYFSVPACTKYKGRHIAGYFTGTESGPVFRVMDRHKNRITESAKKCRLCARNGAGCYGACKDCSAAIKGA